MENIDQLKTEVNNIKDSLNELKNNVSLSEDEKKNQAEALKAQAETTRQKIQAEINALESLTDDESKKKKLEQIKAQIDELISGETEIKEHINSNGVNCYEIGKITKGSKQVTTVGTLQW